MSLTVRRIEKSDNENLAQVIRKAMEDMDCAMNGTVYTDPNTDQMFECYQTERTAYWVAEWNGELIGGSGIGEVNGEPETVCELQRMFLAAEARGKGIGKRLMELCLNFAKESGYEVVYLETFTPMTAARGLYEHVGFEYIENPMGDTGHFSCDQFMIKRL